VTTLPELPSYWHRTTSFEPRHDSLPASIDVAVIGGGFLGSSITYWLARLGVKVALLERGVIAAGASGRNGGLMIASTTSSYSDSIKRFGHDNARGVLQLTIDSRATLRQVLAEEGIDADYREHGNITLSLGEAELAEDKAEVEALNRDGFAGELLDRQQLQEHIHTPLGELISGGIYKPENGQLHSAKFVRGLAAAAQRRGALLCAEVEVQTISPDGEGVLIETNQGTLRAGSLVVAVNAWSSTLIPELKDVITPVRGQVLAYAPTKPVFACGVGAGLTSTGEYWQQTLDGSIVLGGCRAIAPNGEYGVLPLALNDPVQNALDDVFPRLFPQLEGLEVAHRWAGPMAFTKDYTAIADRVPGLANGWFVGGFSGHGMPFGMCLGPALAEAVATGQAPQALSYFRLDRPTLS
jgi:gamma-glutamylputrescine oxidase